MAVVKKTPVPTLEELKELLRNRGPEPGIYRKRHTRHCTCCNHFCCEVYD